MTIKNLKIGDQAPNFVANSTDGELKLSDLKGKNVVIYFYPKDDTPGCTIEAQDFSKKSDQFEKLDCIIIGVSKDCMNSHNKFINKYNLNFELISDEEKTICDLYNVIKEKSMFGKKYQGIDRATFLIDRMGKIIKIWRTVKVKGHVEEVYLELKNSL
ncbi:MAG: thioredoxin-dependent thiol peroxidase [Rickettsiales bacterium]|nr:thioredoxin-dependent thiol peroxidase [Rickettsiales bacterium]|tara:strand:+ start:27977 stop:28450 length:474 start_codon:yes stop_codon:yes gene_type:complete